jgi:prolyl-tRNA synthetase
MRMSQLMGKTHRSDLAAADSTSHGLLLRAGYVRQHATGIFCYLHLGVRSLRRIEAIVREEMDRAGAQEILMSVVHSADMWKRTGRYDEIDETLVRFTDRRGHAMVLAMTHEEIVAQLAQSEIESYRDVGIVVYQIQTKFRDELRSRGGLLRTREFIMKDAYSLSIDDDGLIQAYNSQAGAYKRIFARLGLANVRMIRSDTGLMGGRVAHEFTCLSDAGEDTVALCKDCDAALNVDLVERGTERCICGGTLDFRKGIEVGNIFQLGTRYGDAASIKVAGRDGKQHSLVMGSYGIGISRVLATLIEQHHDDRGIALTAATAAYDGHLVNLSHAGAERAAAIYEQCCKAGLAILWDDRSVSAGAKLADADLIGATVRIAIGSKLASTDQVELTERRTGIQHATAQAEVAENMTRLLATLQQRETAVAQMS